MTDPAVAFASAYDLKFKALTKGLSHAEVPLFRQMHKALVSLSGKFDIEEYHGTAHQVEFTGNGSYARTNARCELSDLMIVTFSSVTKSARLAYLQAKSERATLLSVCGRQFSANLEQWFLLEKHPKITGVGKFNPPSDLLASALLPSVGSFAFFYKDLAGDFQTYYAAANFLKPPKIYSQRYGKLQARGPCHIATTATYPECFAACGNRSFAESLFRLEIGTPIDSSVSQAIRTRNWLASNLRASIRAAQQENTPSGLAQELLGLLAPDGDGVGNGSYGAKNVILIKSNVEPNPSIHRTPRNKAAQRR
jgi:hypothetical protein